MIDRRVRRLHGVYARYADDLAISFPENGPREVRGTISGVRRVARACGSRIDGRPKLGVFRGTSARR